MGPSHLKATTTDVGTRVQHVAAHMGLHVGQLFECIPRGSCEPCCNLIDHGLEQLGELDEVPPYEQETARVIVSLKDTSLLGHAAHMLRC